MPDLIKSAGRRSRSQLLRLIRSDGPVSRADLAERSALTRPTVSAIVGELVAAGLVRETGKGESNGGKRPIMLELAADRHFAIGIDLGEDFVIRGVRVDLAGAIRQAARIEYENRFEAIVDALAELAGQLAAGIDRDRIRGVGVTISGKVDTVLNEVTSSRTLDVANHQLAAQLRDRLRLPVRLENRPTAAALAERARGAGREFKNMIILTSGRGIGVGIVIDGKLFRGSRGAAGELGETEFFFANAGDETSALESRLRPEALTAAAAKAKNRPGMTYAEFLQELAGGDEAVVRLTLEAADTLAYAVKMVVGLLDPEAVILSGQLLELGDLFFERFRSRLVAMPRRADLQVLPSRFRGHGLAPGSAAVILERIFELKPL